MKSPLDDPNAPGAFHPYGTLGPAPTWTSFGGMSSTYDPYALTASSPVELELDIDDWEPEEAGVSGAAPPKCTKLQDLVETKKN